MASGKSQGRSSQINFLHATEVDYYYYVAAGSWDRFKAGIIPSMKVKGAIAIIESTCQGRKALFDLYTQLLNPQSKWKHMFFPWFENPEYISSQKYDLTSPGTKSLDPTGFAGNNWMKALLKFIENG